MRLRWMWTLMLAAIACLGCGAAGSRAQARHAIDQPGVALAGIQLVDLCGASARSVGEDVAVHFEGTAVAADHLRPRPPYRPAPPDFEPGLGERLSNGLPFSLVVEARVHEDGVALAIPVGSCAVSFDLWDEVYRVRVPVEGPNPSVDTVGSLDALVSLCTNTEAFANAATGHEVRRIVRQK